MVAQLESHPTLDPVQKAKTLICALNLISRNLPLPPDVFNAVSSIYHSADSPDRADVDSLDAPSDKVPVGLLSMPPFWLWVLFFFSNVNFLVGFMFWIFGS